MVKRPEKVREKILVNFLCVDSISTAPAYFDKLMKLLNKAAKIAGKNKDSKKYYMACIAVRKDGAIVSSVNHCCTDTSKRVPQHHAEARALQKAGVGAVLFIARVLRKDKKTWAISRPCNYCRNLIRARGVEKVYYTIGPNEYGIWDVQGDERIRLLK